MKSSLSSSQPGRAFTSWILAAAFAFSVAVASSPQLHAWVHPDANKTEHTCAATLIGSGSYEHHLPAPSMVAFDPPSQFSVVDSLALQVVGSIFLGASIFEHAPPARA